MGAFSRAFSAARDGVNARRAEGRRPSNDARFDKKTENSIDKHRVLREPNGLMLTINTDFDTLRAPPS